MARDLMPAAEARRDKALADCGGNTAAALLLLALLLEAALCAAPAGMLRVPPSKN
ncbi:hypothetical protein [Azospirillum sp.]|uniref:hypothetical protein n=1 Tax=Azospirillum sp. TaxID=34012 RepID=UPI003D74EB82